MSFSGSQILVFAISMPEFSDCLISIFLKMKLASIAATSNFSFVLITTLDSFFSERFLLLRGLSDIYNAYARIFSTKKAGVFLPLNDYYSTLLHLQNWIMFML